MGEIEQMQGDKIQELRGRLQGNGDVVEKLVKGGEFRKGEEPLNERYLRRWLRSRGWDVDNAEASIMKHADWRIEICPDGRIKESELPLELGAEKIFLQGTDRAGRGLAIVLVAKHDAWNADRDEVLRSMCYIFDAQIDAADVSNNPNRQMTLMFDLTNVGIFNIDSKVPFAIKELLTDHFIGRFGTTIIYNAPTIFWATWTAFKPVLSAEVLDLIKFVYPDDLGPLHAAVDPKVLPKEYGGEAGYVLVQNAVAKMQKENSS